jgi:hypothetical protein
MLEMFDLFGVAGGATISDDFKWSVAIFRSHGASEVIRRANDQQLRTYYPIRRNKLGNLVPLWSNYLFIEFRNQITLSICRSTSNFIKILSLPDKDGINHPVLVRKNAIDESLRLYALGKFDDREYRRKFYGKNSLVRIIHGDFAGTRVQLLVDITPDMIESRKVPIHLGNWKASIEIFKLGL